jgi:hypothetical protein
MRTFMKPPKMQFSSLLSWSRANLCAVAAFPA